MGKEDQKPAITERFQQLSERGIFPLNVILSILAKVFASQDNKTVEDWWIWFTSWDGK